jgi:Tfp pilus assembly protein PilF
MAGWIPNDKKRNVIPRWRDFKQTIELGELKSITNPKKKLELNVQSPFHASKIQDWQTDRSVKRAIELLNSSIIFEDQENSLNTATFLKSSKESSAPLKKVAEQIMYPTDFDTTFEQLLNLEEFDKVIGGKIKHLRKCLDHNPYNSISWIELARLFLIIGKEQAAERCILVATQLAPDNRYISRIGSRFFTHTGDYKKAKQILKANIAFKADPWLVSADIGISSLADKSSFNIKIGRELVASQNYSAFDLNELFSALATEELNSGNNKNSKRLFNESLVSPNDNSLAQAVWARSHIGDLNLNQGVFDRTRNVFEAKARQFFNGKSWGPAYSSIVQWFIDQPFSSDPAVFGSFIATSLLEKYDEGIKICKYGLKSTPNDFTLLNNLTFAYLKNNNIKEAQQTFARIHSEGLADQQRVVYLATKGLLHYKMGQLESGEALYNEASVLAARTKNKKLQLLADVYHLIAKTELDHDEQNILKLDRLVKELEPMDVVYLKDLVNNLLKKIDGTRRLLN